MPKDYDDLSALLRQRGHTVACAPLSRLSWLRIVPSVFTEAFFKGELKPQGTLDFFFEALDAAVADVGPDEDIAILGHSIGGWVARVGRRPGRAASSASCAGRAAATPEGLFSNIDQTRGLLKYVRANCPPDRPFSRASRYGHVDRRARRRLQARCVGRRATTALQALVSLPSYLALREEPVRVKGALIPVDASAEINQCVRPAWRPFLAASKQRGARPRSVGLSPERLISAQATACLADCPSIEVDCHHSDFVPTALDSIRLPETYPWYGSPAVFEAWADALSIN